MVCSRLSSPELNGTTMETMQNPSSLWELKRQRKGMFSLISNMKVLYYKVFKVYHYSPKPD
jgi:hypothetical protein